MNAMKIKKIDLTRRAQADNLKVSGEGNEDHRITFTITTTRSK